MKRKTMTGLFGATAALTLLLAGCGENQGASSSASGAPGSALAGAPSWCGC
jgi:hypothetical protein